MKSIEPEPPDRSFTRDITIPLVGRLPEPLAIAFAQCAAEAQMLEHALKSAIKGDVQVFAQPGDQTSLLDQLARVTLGQAQWIAEGTSTSRKELAACVGFFDFVKLQWQQNGRLESELSPAFKDAVDRRNRLAHRLIAEVLQAEVSVEEALAFLEDSSARLFEIRCLIVLADKLSSMTGSVRPDGSSGARFKTTT